MKHFKRARSQQINCYLIRRESKGQQQLFPAKVLDISSATSRGFKIVIFTAGFKFQSQKLRFCNSTSRSFLFHSPFKKHSDFFLGGDIRNPVLLSWFCCYTFKSRCKSYLCSVGLPNELNSSTFDLRAEGCESDSQYCWRSDICCSFRKVTSHNHQNMWIKLLTVIMITTTNR